MKKIHFMVYLVTFFSICSLFLFSCKKNQFPVFSMNQVLLYAKPEGGISLFDFSTNQRYSLTTNKDYFPHLSINNQLVYFMRVNSKESNQKATQNSQDSKQIIADSLKKKVNRWAEIYTYSLITNKEKKISSLFLYDPGTDPKDLVKFVDQFRKIIVFSNVYPIRMFEVNTGNMISEDPSSYFAQCNIESNDQSFFIHVRQIPKKDYIISFDQLEIPDYSDSLLESSPEGILKEIRNSGKDQLYKKYFFGFTYYPKDNKFIYSYDHEIFIRNADGEEKLLFSGIHPFCYQNQAINKEYLAFPWFQCSFLLQDKEKVIIGEQNRLSLLDKKKKYLFIVTKEMLQIKNSSADPFYLFDHLEWLGFVKNKSSILLMSSNKIDKNTGPDRIVDLNKNPDLVLLLKWENGKFVKQFETNKKKDFTFDFKDLDKDGQNEIINQYSASNFICEERFQVAGRSLVWIDVFHVKKDGSYEISNQMFPSIYSDLLKKLKPFYQRAIAATRLKEPILCDDDLRKLEALIREAEIIVQNQ